MRSRDQLIQLLDDLEASLPAMVAAHPEEGDFWSAFAGQADVIEDQAGVHSVEVGSRIDAMLVSAALALSKLEER